MEEARARDPLDDRPALLAEDVERVPTPGLANSVISAEPTRLPVRNDVMRTPAALSAIVNCWQLKIAWALHTHTVLEY